jgi:transcriptional regulator with PAS, ATPase and Fis domain
LSGIKSIAEEKYLPVLVLFHHSQYEKKLIRLLDKEDDAELSAFLECVTGYLERAGTSSSFLEKQLGHLWKRRIPHINELINDSPNKAEASRILHGSLKFAEYFVASPGMIEVITEACKINVTNKEKFLPSVLITGGPGSGKDVIAQIIRLFSSDFWDTEPVILNMASFKPEAVSAPLISGIDITLNNSSFKMKSIFLRVSEDTEKPQVVILDELNSLDIEAQGALLRIIENKKITPLGAVIPEVVDCLIIGIMNEDPRNLLMEYDLRRLLKKNQYIGTLGAHLFGEIMKRVKRLREDLYFRLTRAGEIKLPDLNERREDIPILSYVYVLSEFKKGLRNYIRTSGKNPHSGSIPVTFNFDLEAFEVLMDRTIDWTGNVRQLQLVCKAISQETLDSAVVNTGDLYSDISSSIEVSVTRSIADKVLRKYDLIKR